MTVALYVIVVGCGRLGALVATRLSQEGHSVVIIDLTETKLANLSADFSGYRIQNDATEVEVLQQAKAERADILIAATNNDNVNLMVAQIAKVIFHVPHVMARVFNPAREAIYQELGIQVICPTKLSAERFLQAIHTSTTDQT